MLSYVRQSTLERQNQVLNRITVVQDQNNPLNITREITRNSVLSTNTSRITTVDASRIRTV